MGWGLHTPYVGSGKFFIIIVCDDVDRRIPITIILYVCTKQ